jgi:hypothetical protein
MPWEQHHAYKWPACSISVLDGSEALAVLNLTVISVAFSSEKCILMWHVTIFQVKMQSVSPLLSTADTKFTKT